MALNKNMALKKRGSGESSLDERIKASIENTSSSTAYTEALRNLSESPAVPEVDVEQETAVEAVAEEKPSAPKKEKKAAPRKTAVNLSGKGRKTKAEKGEVCREQFSTTLEPDLLAAVRAKAKKERIPFSCLSEKAYSEYLANHP